MAAQMRSTSAMTWSRSLKQGSTIVTSGGCPAWSPATCSVTWWVAGVSASVTGSCAVASDPAGGSGDVGVVGAGCWLISRATLGVVAHHVADQVRRPLGVGDAHPLLRADLDDDQVGGRSPGSDGEVREVGPAGAVGPGRHGRVAGRAERGDVQD